jgi:hypothetical protein
MRGNFLFMYNHETFCSGKQAVIMSFYQTKFSRTESSLNIRTGVAMPDDSIIHLGSGYVSTVAVSRSARSPVPRSMS